MSALLEINFAEEEFYDIILAVYEEVIAERKDLAIAGNYLIVKLDELMKKSPTVLPNAVQNYLLLILSLFFSPIDNEFDAISVAV